MTKTKKIKDLISFIGVCILFISMLLAPALFMWMIYTYMPPEQQLTPFSIASGYGTLLLIEIFCLCLIVSIINMDKEEKTKKDIKQIEKEREKVWAEKKQALVREQAQKYPPNCVNCNMPIKTSEDLVWREGYLYCKYCGSVRLKKGETYIPAIKTIETRSRHISAQVKREVWRRDYGKCVECGSKELLEYDHIIPFSRGGSNTARNIQLLCENCNRKKYDKI